MPNDNIEPGWGVLSLIFRWKWVHKALGHTITDNVCNCGMEWT
jgi:hypothetical protein